MSFFSVTNSIGTTRPLDIKVPAVQQDRIKYIINTVISDLQSIQDIFYLTLKKEIDHLRCSKF